MGVAVADARQSGPRAPLLEIEDLSVSVRRRAGLLRIVDSVGLSLGHDRTLAIVGESGSGKSMLAMSIVRLLGERSRYLISGRISFGGQDLLSLSESEMRRVRGNGIAVIFQDSLNALNPVVPIGRQIGEAVERTGEKVGAAVAKETLRLLDEVKIPSPAQRIFNYPHELSGGMRQRVMIAMALACRPKLIIADEPTTSLDVTIQSQILSLLRDIRRENGMSMIFISHNLGAVAAIADDVAVMYAGQIVEMGSVDEILSTPRHPYTRDLLAATPRVDSAMELKPIPGTVPRFDAMPVGCRFALRCGQARARCIEEVPDLALLDPEGGRHARCFFPIARAM